MKNPSGGYSCRKHNCYGEGDAGGRCPLCVREAIEAGYRSLLGEVRTVLYGEPLSVQAAEAFRARIAYAEELLGEVAVPMAGRTVWTVRKEGWIRHDLRIDGRISEQRGYHYSAYVGEEVPAAEWKSFVEPKAEGQASSRNRFSFSRSSRVGYSASSFC